MERDNMLKDAREIKENDCWFKDEAQAQGLKMIEQAKGSNWKWKLWLNWNSSFYLSLSIAEKLLKELSNKAQTKLVEKMLGDVKLN
jgi:F0F1-type ATP synthase membrane subunit b/b'